jgi:hypothetical protein
MSPESYFSKQESNQPLNSQPETKQDLKNRIFKAFAFLLITLSPVLETITSHSQAIAEPVSVVNFTKNYDAKQSNIIATGSGYYMNNKNCDIVFTNKHVSNSKNFLVDPNNRLAVAEGSVLSQNPNDAKRSFVADKAIDINTADIGVIFGPNFNRESNQCTSKDLEQELGEFLTLKNYTNIVTNNQPKQSTIYTHRNIANKFGYDKEVNVLDLPITQIFRYQDVSDIQTHSISSFILPEYTDNITSGASGSLVKIHSGIPCPLTM